MMNVSRIFTLCVLLMLVAGRGPVVYGGDAQSGKQELDRIKREMREKKRKIRRADQKERSIISEMDKIDRAIQAGSAELLDQQKRLQESEQVLDEVEKRNADINRDLAGVKRVYAQRLRALYKMSRSGYVAAVLTSSGPGGAVKLVKYLTAIAERDRSLIREYRSALEQLAARQAELSAKKEEILARKRMVEVKRVELEDRKQEKKRILAGVREEKGLYEQTLHELEASSVSLWSMIKDDERRRKAAPAVPAPAVVRKGAEKIYRSRLPWPLDGKVLSRFGMQRHPQFGTMVFRRGIEIEARVGEPVRAVEDGTAAYADWYKGYGKLVILDHGNGFYTLYGNLSRADLVKGDLVAKGRVIGLAGDTGSLKGPKLYFEIRRNGTAQDPLVWLAKK